MNEATRCSPESGTSRRVCVKSWWYECSRLSYWCTAVTFMKGATKRGHTLIQCWHTHSHSAVQASIKLCRMQRGHQIGPYSRPRLALNLWLRIPSEFPIKRRIGPWGMSCRRRVCGAGGWWRADPPHLSQNPRRMRRSRGCKLRPGFCSADRIRRDS